VRNSKDCPNYTLMGVIVANAGGGLGIYKKQKAQSTRGPASNKGPLLEKTPVRLRPWGGRSKTSVNFLGTYLGPKDQKKGTERSLDRRLGQRKPV